MKTKIIGLGIVFALLATGLMFCGDDVDPNDEVTTNDFNDHSTNDFDEPPRTESAQVLLRLAQQDHAAPTFWAVRTGDTWTRPQLDAGRARLELAGGEAAFTVVTVCDATDEKGREAVRTTVIEATARELPALLLTCPDAAVVKPVTVAGAVRGANGLPVMVTVGHQTTMVENPKQSKDLLFASTAPPGTQTFVATSGEGEKRLVAATSQDVQAGTPVEIDLTAGQPLQPFGFALSTDGMTRPAGGTAHVWINGRTRIGGGRLTTWTDGDPALGARSTRGETDFIDLRASFRGPSLAGMEFAPIAEARFIRRADVNSSLVLPELTWVGPSYALVGHQDIEFGWSMRNWAVVGHTGDAAAVFTPVAYVGEVSVTAGIALHHLEVVVTPIRVRGPTPSYRVPDLEKIDGWQGRWSFPTGEPAQASSGNLSAFAEAGIPNPAAAISAYLDRQTEMAPESLGVAETLTIVVAGSPVVTVKPDASLTGLLEARCFEQRPCSVKIDENALSVKMCPDLAAYADCRSDGHSQFVVTPEDFVQDLRHEIISWYQAGARIPNALSLDEALARIDVANVHQVTDRGSDEWWAYDPDVYQVFWHPDPTRLDSAAVWYGAYLYGRLISIHAVNWDGRIR